MSAPDPALLLLDLDGTLVDTFPDLAACLDQALAAHGQAAVDRALLRARVSGGAAAMVEVALPQARQRVRDRVRSAFLDIYAGHVARHSRLFPGMREVLDHVEASGRRLGVVTNKLSRFSEPLIDALALDARIVVLVSGDTAPRPKPSPDPLLLAMQRAGVDAARTLYVGDSPVDVTAARAAGVRVVVARYGYLGVDDEPDTWHADGIIDAPSDLMRYLP